MLFARQAGQPSSQTEIPPERISRPVRQAISLCHGLRSERGEISGVRMATSLLRAYRALKGPEVDAFFDLLLKEFSPDPEEVGRAGEAYRQDPSATNLIRLQHVVEPARQELFRRFNMAQDGTRALVDMRCRLLHELSGHPEWAPIETDLAHLLNSWFNRGFLTLKRIDWHTSAVILEKLIEYEAVHEIKGWPDLRRRLQADRRCYAFFHPALPDEPIIFIEVALTRGMSASIQPLLKLDAPVLDPQSANCAMFYSITNCHDGLRGVPFGSFLIKRVAEDLDSEFPRLKTFATISPVPGFRKWLAATIQNEEQDGEYAGLAELMKRCESNEFEDRELSGELGRRLDPLCAHYLLHAKQGKEPLDSVARFHLRNGACLERLNWLGNTSQASLDHSAGYMVNYIYHLGDIERNHELYTREYKVLASRRMNRLAKRMTIDD